MKEIIVGVGIVILVLTLRFLVATLRMWLTVVVHIVLLPVSLVQLVLGYKPWASRWSKRLRLLEQESNHVLYTSLHDSPEVLAAYDVGMQWLQRNHK